MFRCKIYHLNSWSSFKQVQVVQEGGGDGFVKRKTGYSIVK